MPEDPTKLTVTVTCDTKDKAATLAALQTLTQTPTVSVKLPMKRVQEADLLESVADGVRQALPLAMRSVVRSQVFVVATYEVMLTLSIALDSQTTDAVASAISRTVCPQEQQDDDVATCKVTTLSTPERTRGRSLASVRFAVEVNGKPARIGDAASAVQSKLSSSDFAINMAASAATGSPPLALNATSLTVSIVGSTLEVTVLMEPTASPPLDVAALGAALEAADNATMTAAIATATGMDSSEIGALARRSQQSPAAAGAAGMLVSQAFVRSGRDARPTTATSAVAQPMPNLPAGSSNVWIVAAGGMNAAELSFKLNGVVQLAVRTNWGIFSRSHGPCVVRCHVVKARQVMGHGGDAVSSDGARSWERRLSGARAVLSRPLAATGRQCRWCRRR